MPDISAIPPTMMRKFSSRGSTSFASRTKQGYQAQSRPEKHTKCGGADRKGTIAEKLPEHESAN